MTTAVINVETLIRSAIHLARFGTDAGADRSAVEILNLRAQVKATGLGTVPVINGDRDEARSFDALCADVHNFLTTFGGRSKRWANLRAIGDDARAEDELARFDAACDALVTRWID